MSSPPRKADDVSIPDGVVRVLTREIQEKDTLLAKNRYQKLKYVYRYTPMGRKTFNGYWASEDNCKAWLALPEKDRTKNPPPEATVRLVGEVGAAQLGIYGDSADKDGDVRVFLVLFVH
jgi:hypothetical protein